MSQNAPSAFWSVLCGIVAAALGCYLADRLIPSGTPRTLAEVGSVACGLAIMFGGRRLLS